MKLIHISRKDFHYEKYIVLNKETLELTYNLPTFESKGHSNSYYVDNKKYEILRDRTFTSTTINGEKYILLHKKPYLVMFNSKVDIYIYRYNIKNAILISKDAHYGYTYDFLYKKVIVTTYSNCYAHNDEFILSIKYVLYSTINSVAEDFRAASNYCILPLQLRNSTEFEVTAIT